MTTFIFPPVLNKLLKVLLNLTVGVTQRATEQCLFPILQPKQFPTQVQRSKERHNNTKIEWNDSTQAELMLCTFFYTSHGLS